MKINNNVDLSVQGKRERLEQVFGNLISNALSFIPEKNGQVQITAEKRKNNIIVSVEDNGPGIPDNKVEEIFSRFYTERPHENYGGHSGLGLSISKQIIDAHDGEIWAENKRDSNGKRIGAVFKVKLQAV